MSKSFGEAKRIIEKIKKKSRGKNTRILILKAMLKLGPGPHKGREIREKYQKMFDSHFDYLYIESLVFSYNMVVTNQQMSHSTFARLAKDMNFEIRDKYYDALEVLLS